MAEGVGFEPTVAFRLRLISSQVPSTTQPPFPAGSGNSSREWETEQVQKGRHTAAGLLAPFSERWIRTRFDTLTSLLLLPEAPTAIELTVRV